MSKDRSAIVFGGAGFIDCHLLWRPVQSERYGRLFSVDIAAPRFTDAGVQYIGFHYGHDLATDQSAWKQSSKVTDFD